MKTLKRLLLSLGSRAVVWGLVIPVLWLIEPFHRIRITHVWSARFGELILSLRGYIAERLVDGPERKTTRLFIGASPCNRQLFTMFQRILPLHESRLLSAIYNYAGRAHHQSRFFAPILSPVRAHQVLHEAGPVLTFTTDEEERAADFLTSLGIGRDDWFICFQARDASYHFQRVGARDNKAHRSCRTESYLKATALVSRLGGFSVRVGATAERPLPKDTGTRIIDYTKLARSDFGDMALFAKCRFFLGSATGSADAPLLFGKPSAVANLLPLSPNPWGPHSMFTPKLFRDPASGASVPFAILAAQHAFSYRPADRVRWDHEDTYAALGLDIVDNTDDEIMDLCRDMLDQLDGKAPDPEVKRLQRLFKERFYSECPGFLEYGPEIGPSFALKYRALIEG